MPRKSVPSYQTCNSIFAKRLTETMKKRGENQTSLADKVTAQYITIQRQTISLYMNGQSKPDTERLTAIAKVLNVSSDWLLGLTDDTPTANYSARKISETTGISVEIVEYFMLKKQRCKHPSDNHISIFNLLFTPDKLHDLLRTVLLMNLALISGETVCSFAKSELEELQQADISESYERSRDLLKQLEREKDQIRLNRFDSIESFTNALNTTFGSTYVLKEIDNLIDKFSDITDVVDRRMIEAMEKAEE